MLPESPTVRSAGTGAPGGFERSEGFVALIRREFPDFRIVAKDRSSFSIALHVGLCILTLGAQRQFLSHYHTVIGNTLYVPASWPATSDVDRVILLRHELVHLRQRRRYGTIGMALLYLFPFFPIGLAYGRARLEWEAYEETLRATAELRGLTAASSSVLREKIVNRFVGPAYAWMWPFRAQVERWYDTALSALAREQRTEVATSPLTEPRASRL
jgi:hypothetical protein